MRILFIFIIAAVYSSILNASGTLQDAKIKNNHLVLKFSKPVSPSAVRYFILKSNKSIMYVFDFRNTIIRDRSLIKKLSHSMVKKIRISQFNRSTVRVVIKTLSKYNPSRSIEMPYKYKISLPSAKKQNFNRPSDLFASIASSAIKQKIKIKIKKDRSNIKHLKRQYVIVVDPGHGGKDTGATSGRRYKEKNIVLAISKKVRKHLRRLGFRVYMTRTNDRFIRLRNRTRYANQRKADAFVSIHANAASGHRKNIAKGIESYYLQVTRSARSMRIAKKENSVVRRAKDAVSKNVILNLITGQKIVMSNKLAIDLQKGMLKNTRKRYTDTEDHGVRPGPFWVLVGAQMPAVLVEVGYITHPIEKRRLINPKYQDLIAKGIAEGISSYFANMEKEFE